MEALKTSLGPPALFCLVTVLNLMNGLFPQNDWTKKKRTLTKPVVENEQTELPTIDVYIYFFNFKC